MLTLENVHVSYGPIRALHGVSMTIGAGEVVTLIGANGAGKSTTLRAISGLVHASSGRILFEDKDITQMSSAEIVRLGIGHSPEGRRVFANMTVRENLELGAYCRKDRAGIREDFDRAITLFPRLKERIGQNAGTLSGGEQQMLAMGRALMGRPKLLLLDEPSLGLAPFLIRDIFSIITDINKQGTTVLLVEQNAHMALGVAHKGYVLETGHIILSDSAQQLLANDDIKKAYLGE
ncbi:ABC transporter ATP-binding protein [Capsulimonas corticalis]|uniref:ABC transporter ATP-binding protein n=1 Tax=Capsulimonas corticalis TaxID=2219043 RepID=A0A402CXA5_9BACT|nr:ABC transporter ATP-binding protein [Capsulimonas corticalis]BDI32394.1 ABC transporter ATP-binding protein [Capsulimonas corticalis]